MFPTPMFRTVAAAALVLCAACASSAPGRFTFASGGAHHPEGFGEWRVSLDAGGRCLVAHETRDGVRRFGPFLLGAEERETIWTLVRAAQLEGVEDSAPPFVAGTVLLTFRVDETTRTLTPDDVRADPDVQRLVAGLERLIRRHARPAQPVVLG